MTENHSNLSRRTERTFIILVVSSGLVFLWVGLQFALWFDGLAQHTRPESFRWAYLVGMVTFGIFTTAGKSVLVKLGERYLESGAGGSWKK